MPVGNFGRVRAWNDFTAKVPITAAADVPLDFGSLLGGGWSLHGDEEGTATTLTDEPGGVLSLVSDTGDDDSSWITAGVWKPSDGGMECEFRIKIPTSVSATRSSAWAGFTETMAVDTPVMPFETATTTTTYNGSGGMVGFGFDSDATAIRWRFAAGDGGAALATVEPDGTVGTALGIIAPATIATDTWWVFRVEIDTNGLARGYIGDAAGNDPQMRLVGTTTAAVGVNDNFHATTGQENRSAANEEFEVDYAYAQGWRNWSAS